MEWIADVVRAILESNAYREIFRIANWLLVEKWPYVFWGGMFVVTIVVVLKIIRAMRRKGEPPWSR